MVRANHPAWTGPWIRNLLALKADQKKNLWPTSVVSFWRGKKFNPQTQYGQMTLRNFFLEANVRRATSQWMQWSTGKSSLCICQEICVGAPTANYLSVLVSSLCKVSIFPLLHRMKLRILSCNLITSLWHHFRHGRQSYDKYLIEHSAQ